MSLRPAALLRGAIDVARSRPGVRSVRLTVTDGNAPAIRLYESQGFVAWGTEPDAMRWDGQSVTEWHMDLRL